MKLLIVTQAVDTEDPVLGFFHSWIAELAKRTEHIEVVCLKEGAHDLPGNVRIHSLGKERGRQSRLAYAIRFKMLIWKLRREYDTVFVHMNPEYVMLGGLFWKLSRKRVTFWYNHPHDDLRLRLAMLFANRIFYTSPYAATASSRKALRMPVGVDTDLFAPQPVARNRKTIYMQGRIMPSKRVDLMLQAMRILRETDKEATLTLVGPEDPKYGTKLRIDFKDLIDDGAVTFAGPVKNSETPAYYSAAGVAVNLASAGHFDKSVFEAMACETPVIVSSRAFSDLLNSEWIISENDVPALARALAKMLALREEEYRNLGAEERSVVIRTGSLKALIDTLGAELQNS